MVSSFQPQVRVAAVSCLNAWHTELGLVPMVEQEFLTTALATESPNLRAEVKGRGEGGGRVNWYEVVHFIFILKVT